MDEHDRTRWTRTRKPGLAWTVRLASLLVALSGTAYGLSVASGDRAGEAAGRSVASAQLLTELELVDHHGKRLRKSDLKGRVVLLNFFFTGCSGVCPMQTAVLRDVRRDLDPSVDVLFVSASIAPLWDTPDEMRRYIDRHGIAHPDWKLVRAGEDDTERLIERFRVTLDGGVIDSDQPNHRDMGFLFGRDGRLMQQYRLVPGIDRRLRREITEVSRL